MYVLWDHLRRKAGNDKALFHQDTQKLKFVTTPIVLFMKAEESDVPLIAEKLGGVSPSAVFSHEVVSDQDLLNERLARLPFTFPVFGNASVHRRAADEIMPPTNADEPPLEEENHPSLIPKLDEIRAEHLRSKRKKESRFQTYNRLRIATLKTARAVSDFLGARPSVPGVAERLEQLIRNLSTDSYLVGFFGSTAAGKSTLINALAGGYILSEGLGEKTKTTTFIKPPTRENPHGTAVVRYQGLKEIADEIKDYLRSLSIPPHGIPGQGQDESVPDYIEKLFRFLENQENADKLEPCLQYLAHIAQGWTVNERKLGREISLSIPEAAESLRRECDAAFVDDVVFFHSNKLTERGITVADTPGLASAVYRHSRQAVRIAGQADAAIFVTRVDFRLVPFDRKFLMQALECLRTGKKNNLVFVLNQIGSVKSTPGRKAGRNDHFSEPVKKLADKFRRDLREMGIIDHKISCVDAACGFWSRVVIDNPDDEGADHQFRHYAIVSRNDPQPDPEQNFAASRLRELEDELLDHLCSVRFQSSLSAKLNRFSGTVHDLIESVETILKTDERDLEALRTRLQEVEARSGTATITLDYYLDRAAPRALREDQDCPDVFSEVQRIVGQIIRECAREYVGTDAVERSSDSIFSPTGYNSVNESVKRATKDLRAAYERCWLNLKNNSMKADIAAIFEQFPGRKILESMDDQSSDVAPVPVIGLDSIDPFSWNAFLSEMYELSRNGLSPDDIEKALSKRWQRALAAYVTTEIVEWAESDFTRIGTHVRDLMQSVIKAKRNEILHRISLLESKRKEQLKWLEGLTGIGDQAPEVLKLINEIKSQTEKID